MSDTSELGRLLNAVLYLFGTAVVITALVIVVLSSADFSTEDFTHIEPVGVVEAFDKSRVFIRTDSGEGCWWLVVESAQNRAKLNAFVSYSDIEASQLSCVTKSE